MTRTSRDAFRIALAALADKARSSLPEAGGRIDAAVKTVLAGDVELRADGTAQVASATNPLKRYAVNGVCPCHDFPRAPSNLCRHRLAMIFARRTQAARPVVTAAADSRSLNQAGAGQDDDNPAWSTLATDQPHISTRQQPTGDPRGHRDANATLWTSENLDATSTVLEGKNKGPSPTVPAEFIVHIQGKAFVKFAGLLQLAHAQQ